MERGDRLLLCAPNSPEVAIAYFAIHWLGAVAVPLDPGLPTPVLRQVFADCQARLALIGGREVELPETESLYGVANSAVPVSVGDPVCRPHDIADILYTTGTTGARKGVVLTHANIFAAATNMTAFIQNDANDLEVVPLPLSHSFGLGRLRCLAVNGNALVIERDFSNPAAVLKRMVDRKATGLALVPSGFDILKRLTRDYLSAASGHLRYVEIGSMPMRNDTKEWLMRMLPNTRLCHHYGSTEASRAAFTEYHTDAGRPGTVGRPTPNVEITVRDDADASLPARTEGEIVVRGGMVMREYWGRPDLTEKVLTAAGMHTGDYGYLDPEGYLHLLGRKDDIINVGGLKVVPDEVEAHIRGFHGVDDAACVGVPDPLGLSGQCVKAFIVADHPLSQTHLTAWLREQLEEYKIPRTLEYCTTIPRTGSGKVQRHKLRDTGAAHGS